MNAVIHCRPAARRRAALACRAAAMVTMLTTTTDTSITAATPRGIAFQGERVEVFPGELLAGERRTMSPTGAARWPA